MAKVRERVMKADTLFCYVCDERTEGDPRVKYIEEMYQVVFEATVSDEELVKWMRNNLTEGIWCSSCEELRYEDYDYFEKGQTVFECVECGSLHGDSQDAGVCC